MTAITLFTVNGTGIPADTTTGVGFAAAVGAGVNQSFYTWTPIDYEADLPLQTSYQQGVNHLAEAIDILPEGSSYALCGYNQGAMVVSQTLNAALTGITGANNSANLLAGVTFGSPMRQSAHSIPHATDPGGAGIMSSQFLLTNTPTWWWDFAVAGDPITCNPATTTGQVATAVFMDLYTSWSGDLPTLLTLIDKFPAWTSLVWQIAGIVQGQITGAMPHGQYGTNKPIAGNNQTCIQLAINFLNGLALLHGTGALSVTAKSKQFRNTAAIGGAGTLTGDLKPKKKSATTFTGAGSLGGLTRVYHNIPDAANLTGTGVLAGNIR